MLRSGRRPRSHGHPIQLSLLLARIEGCFSPLHFLTLAVKSLTFGMIPPHIGIDTPRVVPGNRIPTLVLETPLSRAQVVGAAALSFRIPSQLIQSRTAISSADLV